MKDVEAAFFQNPVISDCQVCGNLRIKQRISGLDNERKKVLVTFFCGRLNIAAEGSKQLLFIKARFARC